MNPPPTPTADTEPPPQGSGLANPSALITGATGFIGRHLVRTLLSQGWHVHALTRPTLTPRWSFTAPRLAWHPYDGTMDSVQAAVAAGRPKVAFHLATLFRVEHTPAEIEPIIKANVLLGTQLCEALVQHGCTNLVNAGTVWQNFESRPYDPVNLYAAAKQAFQDILEYYAHAKNMRIITLKIFDTFGPDDDRNKVLTQLERVAAAGTEIGLTPGHQLLNMVYIDDAIAAFVQAASRLFQRQTDGQEVFALPAAETVSLRDLVALVQEVLGRPIDARWGARPYRPREVLVPWKGPVMPGWSCQVSLKEGLRRTFGLTKEAPT
jgi:nucleoside-diphosphate-sugar epimerase